jgi:hypothetical protein
MTVSALKQLLQMPLEGFRGAAGNEGFIGDMTSRSPTGLMSIG